MGSIAMRNAGTAAMGFIHDSGGREDTGAPFPLAIGSAIIGGSVAVLEPAINTVAFFGSGQAWQRGQELLLGPVLDGLARDGHAHPGMTPG